MATVTAVTEADRSKKMQEEAERLADEAGSEPADAHYDNAMRLAKQNIEGGMIESESIQRITNMLVQGRSECSTHTLDQAKMLRLVVQRMSERRLKIKRLEKKRLEILGRGEFETDIQSKNNDMAMDEIDRRIKLERDSMKRDEAFAREITENVAGELSGL